MIRKRNPKEKSKLNVSMSTSDLNLSGRRNNSSCSSVIQLLWAKLVIYFFSPCTSFDKYTKKQRWRLLKFGSSLIEF